MVAGGDGDSRSEFGGIPRGFEQKATKETKTRKVTNEEQARLFSHQQRKEFEQEATEETEKQGKSCARARSLVLLP